MSSHLSSSAAAPLEDENLFPEILLRLPPQPSSLPRASLVCKRWCRLASNPSFLRHFRIHHRRSPPLLGCLVQDPDGISFLPTSEPLNRLPPGRFSLQFLLSNGFTLHDCRHGLVLMSDQMRRQFVVWDPVTGDQHRLPIPPGFDPRTTRINGAVLRAAGDVKHFQLVFVAAYNHGVAAAAACLYSSETGVWGNIVSTPIPFESDRGSALYQMFTFGTISTEPAVLVGDSIYWILANCSSGILEFNFEMQRLAAIRVPHLYRDHFKLIKADSGGLGLLHISDFTMQVCNYDGVASWRLGRTIELDKLLPLNPYKDNIMLGAFAEENNMVFLWTLNGLYAIHLQSLEVKKLPETTNISHYYPFESVNTTGRVLL
ncbi:hypothetical protein CFC21_086652 [Triticum aestivum]|uniref:Uncharacterized protein n=3 Tax=Triticum TaxID=4564 RepID=A0A3B6PIA2_WHEAT|nr:uncharacterized protein LOC123133515 [Triticum aestivum]KAF7082801.1 hypothetical protein CFC21_086652 [Triticum aestivum]